METLIGKHLIVVITITGSDGCASERFQVFGKIVSADYDEGIFLERDGAAEHFAIPPVPECFETAADVLSGSSGPAADFICRLQVTLRPGQDAARFKEIGFLA
ncbi:MAG: hypothetical protein KJ052_19915 [Candidatus Hydrogenedentes bacterium]|nr:hypothetical protein [Candidatus Hydrogenedentota bacterium]